MTKTTTLSDRRGQAQAAIEEASARLEQLADEHASLSLAAFEGDEEAIARVAQIDEEITSSERRKRLAEDALAEISTLEQEAEVEADRARREELSTEFDRLVVERRSALKRFEKALDGLQSTVDAVLEVDHRQREIGAELGLIDSHIAPYSLAVKDRILTKLPGLLGVGPTTLYPSPLTEETGVFTETVAESEARKQEGLRQAEESRAEEGRVRAIVERAERIQHRRDEHLARAGYVDAVPAQRADIEAQVEQWLAQEFGEEQSQ